MNTSQSQSTLSPALEDTLLSVSEILQKYSADTEYYLDTEEGVTHLEQMVTDFIKYNLEDPLYDVIVTTIELLKGELQSLQQTNVTLYNRIQRAIAKGQWYVLSRFPASVVTMLFENYIEFFFDYDWQEIDQKTRTLLLYEPSYDERDRYKKQWKELISSSSFEIFPSTSNSAIPTTIAGWVKDFQLFIKEQPISPLLIVEYMNRSAAIKAITDAIIRQKIEGMLRFMEILQRSSWTAEGTEESFLFGDPFTGTYKFFDRGEVEETGIAIPKEDLEILRYSYNIDENGKPKSFAEQVQTSPLIESRYSTPEQIQKKSEQPVQTSVPPTQTPSPARTIEEPTLITFPQAAQKPQPENPTVIEPIIEDEHLVPPPPQEPELPTMRITPEPPVVKSKKVPAPPAPRLSQKISAPKGMNYQMMAKQVLSELKLLLPSIEMEKRFLSILSSYFRGVRDKMELAEVLRQTEKEGGIHLPSEQVEAVQVAADQILEYAQKHPTGMTTATQQVTQNRLTPTLDMVQKRITEQKQMETKKDNALTLEEGTEQIEDIFSNVNPEPVQPTNAQQLPAHASTTQNNTQQKNARSTQTNTTPAQTASVMNPIDELRTMNVKEFRRLSDTPQESAKKIMQMIELLAEESLAKKADGLQAWKASTLHKEYVAIGNASLESGKPIDVLISQMQKTQPDTLTTEEFRAIADINQKMRF